MKSKFENIFWSPQPTVRRPPGGNFSAAEGGRKIFTPPPPGGHPPLCVHDPAHVWMPLTNYFCGVFCWLAEVCSKLLRFPIFLWVKIAITWVFLFCLGWHFWAPFFEKKKVFHERFYESTHWLRRILKRKFSTFFQSDTMVKDSVKFLVDAMMKQDDSIDSIASKDASNQKDVEEVTLKDSNLQEKVPPPLCLC